MSAPSERPAARRLAAAILIFAAAALLDLFGGAARARLADFGRRRDEIAAWRAGYEAERARLAAAVAALPDAKGALAAFDEAIERAKGAGVILSSLRSLGTEREGDFAVLRVEVVARGPYGGLRAFLRALEAIPLPLHVESVESAPSEAAPGELSLAVSLAALYREAEAR